MAQQLLGRVGMAVLMPCLWLVIAVLAPLSAHATSLTGTVVRVVDGDTIHVQIGSRVEKVRGLLWEDQARTVLRDG